MRKLQIALGVLMITTVALLAGCGSGSPVAPPRVSTTVRLSLAANQLELHQETVASAVALDQFGAPIAAGPATYTSAAEQIAVVGPTSGKIFALSPGTTQIIATIAGKTDQRTITVFKSPIRINEIKPNGDAPGGWVEFFNPTTATVDMSDWTLTASDVFQSFTLPAGTSIPAGGFLVVEEARFPAGLRSADAVHAFSRFGVQVDSHSWTVDTASSYGRCPDGTGAFVTTTSPTRASANACPVSVAAQAH